MKCFLKSNFWWGKARVQGEKIDIVPTLLERASLMNESFRGGQKQAMHDGHSLVFKSERRRHLGQWEVGSRKGRAGPQTSPPYDLESWSRPLSSMLCWEAETLHI